MRSFAILLVSLFCFGCAASSGDYRVSAAPPAPAAPGAPRVLGLVRVKAPWYAPRSVIRSRFRDAVPEYEGIAAIERKYFTISDDRRYGGIYVFRTREDADAFYSEAWRSGIRARRGVEPDLRLFAIASIVDGRTTIHGEPLGARATVYPATAVLAEFPRCEEGAGLSADALARTDGLVRAFVVASGCRQSVVALFASRELAERAELARVGASLGEPTVTYFEAPVLIDASLR